jgi:hypothetical protein
MIRLFLAVPLAAACGSSGRIASSACGDLGPAGDVRAQLRVLDCLTAVAALDTARQKDLRPRIQRGFRQAYRDLLREPMVESVLAEWTELYRLQSRFYPRTETLGGKDDVPITFVNAHHFSVPFWIRRSQETALGTLVHFDTHSDTEPVARPDDVRRAVGNIRAGRDLEKSWHLIAHAVYRNSMPVTAAVLAAGITEVIWAKPSWATEPVDFHSQAFFYARPKGALDPRPLSSLEAQGPHAFAAAFRAQTTDFFQMSYDAEDNEGRWLPRAEREVETWTVATKRPHEKHYERVTPIRFSVLTTDRAAGASQLPMAVRGERFVLDIDLDYFVNLGSEVEVTDDRPSFGQRVLRREDQPEGALGIFQLQRLRAAGIAAERAIIERRIESFREVLLALRRAGKRPSIVSIADSANLPFTSFREGQERSEFVPPHHATSVHERVVAVIREVFGDGPKGGEATPAPRPHPPPGRGAPVFEATHEAHGAVLDPVGKSLVSAVAWATGAASSYRETPHLSTYLLVLRAIAAHGPEVGIRRMAREAARIHAAALDPRTLGPLMEAQAEAVEESLRRIHFARHYGAPEAEVALAAARWMAGAVRLQGEPDIDRDSSPLKPSEALTLLGLKRTFSDLQEPSLADLFVGLQATDGGYGPSEMPAPARAAYSLLAVRALLGLLPTAALPEPDTKPLWAGYPVREGDLQRALLRATLFLLAHLGENPSTEDAVDALFALRTAARARGTPEAARIARLAGRMLASRVAPKATLVLATLADPELLASFADLCRVLADFEVDIRSLREALAARVALHPREKVLGVPARGRLAYGQVFPLVARSYALDELGIPGFSFSEALQRALPLTGAATFTTEQAELMNRFNAVAHVLLTSSGHRRVALDRAHYPGEWAFLEQITLEALASRRADMVSTLLEATRILGETGEAPRYRNLVWQLLHDQNPDGSWGRTEPTDARLRTTWAAISALADLEPGEPTRLTRVAARLARSRERPTAPVAAAAPAAYVPGTLMGKRAPPGRRRRPPRTLLRFPARR